MTSSLDPYVYSGLLAAKTMGMKGMNTTYQVSQKDLETLKVPFAQASILLMSSNDNLHFPEYKSFKSTILALADKIYGKDSIGTLLKTILDSMTVNTDGNLVLSTTNSNQIEKVKKLASDYEYEFETTYGAALFDTLGIDIVSQENRVKSGVKSKKIPTKKSTFRANGMPNSAAAAAGGAQVGGQRLARLSSNEELKVLDLLLYLIDEIYGSNPAMVKFMHQEAEELVIKRGLFYEDKYEDLLPMLLAVFGHLNIKPDTKFPFMEPEKRATSMGMRAALSQFNSRSQAVETGAAAAHRGQNRGAAQAARRGQEPGAAMVAYQNPEAAQPRLDLYDTYQRLGDHILERDDIRSFDHMFMRDIERGLLRQSARPDFEPERVAGFLLQIAQLRAQQGIMNPSVGSREAVAYLEIVNKRMTDSIPDWTETIVATGVTGLAVYAGTGIVAMEAGIAHFLMPPGLLSGTSGLNGWEAFMKIIDNLGYHTIFSFISNLFVGKGGQEFAVGVTRVVIALLIGLLVILSILLHKKIVNTLRKSPEEGAAEFDKVVINLQNAVMYGIQETAKRGAVAARDVALTALGIAGTYVPIVAAAAGRGALALVDTGRNATKRAALFLENSADAVGSAVGSAARSSRNVGQRAASKLASTASTLASKASSLASSYLSSDDQKLDTNIAALDRAWIYAKPQQNYSADAAPLAASSSMPRQSQASIRMIPQQMSQSLQQRLFGQLNAEAVNASGHQSNNVLPANRGFSASSFNFSHPPQRSNRSEVQRVYVPQPPPVSTSANKSSAAIGHVKEEPFRNDRPVLASQVRPVPVPASAAASNDEVPNLEPNNINLRGGRRRKYSGRRTKHKKRHNKRHTKRHSKRHTRK